MKTRNQILLLLGSVALQAILPTAIGLYEALKVQFALVAVVYFALRHDWFASVMVGVAGGAIMDVFSGGRLGIYALSYGLVGMLIGRVRENLFQDNLLTIATVIICASLMSPLLVLNLLALYGIKLDYVGLLTGSVLPTAAANAVVGCTIFRVSRRMKRGRSAVGKRAYR